MTPQAGQQLPPSVGLAGDGDEIDAIEHVEATFGVQLDNGDASNWVTAGDVYRSLCKALPAEEVARPDVWERFAAALTDETGVDPKGIQWDSPLLSPPIASTWLWLMAAVAIGVLVAAIVLL